MDRTPRVLIVEDSEDDALLVLRELRKGGYHPAVFHRVETAEEMRARLVEQPWDLIIADFAMPRFTALAALEVIEETGLDLPFIVVSGTIGEETAVGAMKAGAHDYIMKGNLKRLIPAIERELREAEVRKKRRRAEQALRESEERYRCLVENVDFKVRLIDVDHNVVMANAVHNEIFTLPVSESIGKKCHLELESRDSICSFCPGTIAMVSGKPSEIETDVLSRNGTEVAVRIQAFPTFGEGGEVTGCIEIVEDITERKRFEEQLREAAKMEAIGRLAGGVAHDFNNLLTAVIGYSNVLLNEMPKESPLTDKVVQINRAAERAARLTRQLLTFGRKEDVDMKILQLNPVISDFHKILKGLIGTDIELVNKLDRQLGQVKGDSGRIEQILLNLAVNARDAMPNGGTLSMETANVELDEEYARTHANVRPGKYVVITVSDTGIGMDALTRSKVFEPFFTTKDKGKGTGLGLSTVFGIVRQHEGHIEIASEMGRGTTVHVYLPRVDGELEKPGEKLGEAAHPEQTYTVLVVEDDEIISNLCSEILQLQGYSVLNACKPADALETAVKHEGPIDLLLTDLVLPGMDGATLYHKLTIKRPDTKVLYISGYSESWVMNQGVLHKGASFLQKPFTADLLATRVRELLQGRSS